MRCYHFLALLLLSSCATPVYNNHGFHDYAVLTKSCHLRSGPGKLFKSMGVARIGQRIRYAELTTYEWRRYVEVFSRVDVVFLDRRCFDDSDDWARVTPDAVYEIDFVDPMENK